MQRGKCCWIFCRGTAAQIGCWERTNPLARASRALTFSFSFPSYSLPLQQSYAFHPSVAVLRYIAARTSC